LVFSQIVSFVR